MMRAVTRNSGRLLALAVLFIPLAAAGFAATELYRSHAANAAAIAAKRENLGRLTAMIAQKEAIDAWLLQLSQRTGEEGFLSGSSLTLTSADLQARLAEIAAQRGVMLTSFQPLELTPAEGLVDIGVEIAANGNLSSIVAMLQEIESAVPLLFVRTAIFRSQSGSGYGETSEPVLEAEFRVHGFAEPELGAAPDGPDGDEAPSTAP